MAKERAQQDAAEKLKGEMVVRAVSSLDLDPRNPRLPEELIGAEQETLLRYLYDNAVLEELAQSFVDNGFFTHEPLIITPSEERGRFIALEGNRRLATLMILLKRPEAADLDLGVDITTARRAELAQIPCYEVATREEVYAFLGFRHIGGIKKWGAEAKARYLTDEVERAVTAGAADPFREVGKRVGSNALGVRNSYLALAILKFAQDEFGTNTRHLRNKRFGVWTRALNSPEIRDYIGFGEVSRYEQVDGALRRLKRDQMERVIHDLTPPTEGGKSLVEDSRDITDYGRILTNDRASEMLRRYGDFKAAQRVINELHLPTRIRRLRDECETVLQDVREADPSEDLLAAASELNRITKSILGTVRESLSDEE